MSAAARPFIVREETLAEWMAEGERLGAEERAAESLMWRVGDWWNRGERYGERAQVVTRGDWTGPAHGTCREAGRIAARFDVSSRLDTLSFRHHQVLAALPDEEIATLAEWCGKGEDRRSSRELSARVKQVKRARREAALADKIAAEADAIGLRRYGVIYADPPWRFEPWSRASGMDRAADNHYPTMSQDDLAALELPASEDCVLFCWATVPMLPAGMAFLSDHGFTYRTAYAWVKPGPGTGYWSQSDQIELLLVGTRGEVPAPAPGEQPPQAMTFPRGRHSEKPEAFAAMIERLFPSLPRLEMFARRARPDWDAWGGEAP